MTAKITAYAIIPLYTYLFAHEYDWFTTNLSAIANFFDKKRAFFIWGILVGGYYYTVHRKIRSLGNPGPLCSRLIPAAIVFLFSSIITPYLPDEMPLKALLHIIFASVSALLLFLYLLIVVLRQYRTAPKRYLPFTAALAAIILISLILLLGVGIVSSALEVFVTVATVIFSDRLADSMKEGSTAAPFPSPAPDPAA